MGRVGREGDLGGACASFEMVLQFPRLLYILPLLRGNLSSSMRYVRLGPPHHVKPYT